MVPAIMLPAILSSMPQKAGTKQVHAFTSVPQTRVYHPFPLIKTRDIVKPYVYSETLLIAILLLRQMYRRSTPGFRGRHRRIQIQLVCSKLAQTAWSAWDYVQWRCNNLGHAFAWSTWLICTPPVSHLLCWMGARACAGFQATSTLLGLADDLSNVS